MGHTDIPTISNKLVDDDRTINKTSTVKDTNITKQGKVELPKPAVPSVNRTLKVNVYPNACIV